MQLHSFCHSHFEELCSFDGLPCSIPNDVNYAISLISHCLKTIGYSHYRAKSTLIIN